MDLNVLFAPQPPVKIGQEFKFEGYKCVVTRTLNSSFTYNYVNSTLKKRKDMLITYNYWQHNIDRQFGYVLKGGRQLPWNKPELVAERKLRRLKEELLVLATRK